MESGELELGQENEEDNTKLKKKGNNNNETGRQFGVEEFDSH